MSSRKVRIKIERPCPEEDEEKGGRGGGEGAGGRGGGEGGGEEEREEEYKSQYSGLCSFYLKVECHVSFKLIFLSMAKG